MNKISFGVIGVILLWHSFIFGRVRNDETAEPIQKVFHGGGPGLAVGGMKIHLVFASGDSIFYSYSSDKGKNFSKPEDVGVLRGLMVAGGRGPQIAFSKGQLLIAAPASSGDIHTFIPKKAGGGWIEGGRINDRVGMAKEGFVSITGDDNGHVFAVWLDLRSNAKNKIYGARSDNGGKTWLTNQLIYESPDGSVCECCRPTIVTKEQSMAVMFRNNLNGNRDLYIIQSRDNGATYGTAQKLGQGSWKLNACPMDGGSMVINDDNTIRTVWNREGNIFTNNPGNPEQFLVKGWQCTIAGKNDRYIIAYVNEGKIYCQDRDANAIELGMGGSYPKLIMVDESTVLCTWENRNLIHNTLLKL